MTARDSYLRRTYGITEAQYDEAFARQGGHCAICSKRSPRRALEVDHDHVTGEWRESLICHRCNEAVGRFEWDLTVLQAAAYYLLDIVARREKWLSTHR